MSRRRKKGGGGHEAGGGQERWLLTYADMITLLLALFIILFAMSTIDPAKYERLRQVLAEEFQGSVMTGGATVLESADSPFSPSLSDAINARPQQLQLPRRAPNEAEQAARVKAEAEKVVKAAGFQGKTDVIVSERGVVIRLANQALFDSGSATLKPGAERMLRVLARELAPLNRFMAVDGHTDGQPINTARFPSNWELSAARAIAVGRYMIAHGVPERRMQMSGFADTRPLVKPPSKRAAVAKNRRVEIVIKAGTTAAADGSASQPKSGASSRPNRPSEPPQVVNTDEIIGPIVDFGGGSR